MLKGYADDKKFKLAVIKLKRHASLWYENVKHQRKHWGKSKITTWSKLKTLLYKRSVPTRYKQDLYIQLASLKQEGMDVEDYIQEFEQLLIRTDVQEDEEHTIAKKK